MKKNEKETEQMALSFYQKELERFKREYDRAKGMVDARLQTLKKEFNVDSLTEARKLLGQKEKILREKQSAQEKSITEFIKDYERYVAHID